MNRSLRHRRRSNDIAGIPAAARGGKLSRLRRLAALVAIGLVAAIGSMTPVEAEEGRRTAILCAYQPECDALLLSVAERRDDVYSGVTFVSGRVDTTPVVVIESGVGMVNATLSAQVAIDRFRLDRFIVMGIAGGVNPDLHIGDVVIPAQWREYLETVFAREKDGQFALPTYFAIPQSEHFGMIFPQPVRIQKPAGGMDLQTWFPADATLLDVARKIPASITLESCTDPQKCLSQKPRLVVGGNGVSGSAFVDNAAFRRFTRQTFDADALDMESAAVAHVAYMNKVPFLAIRSLSDLAGEDPDKNGMEVFQNLSSKNAIIVLKALLSQLPQVH